MGNEVSAADIDEQRLFRAFADLPHRARDLASQALAGHPFATRVGAGTAPKRRLA